MDRLLKASVHRHKDGSNREYLGEACVYMYYVDMRCEGTGSVWKHCDMAPLLRGGEGKAGCDASCGNGSGPRAMYGRCTLIWTGHVSNTCAHIACLYTNTHTHCDYAPAGYTISAIIGVVSQLLPGQLCAEQTRSNSAA